ncbi:MAG: large subunit ribosomal protein [Chloroflexota bacterium]|jgi:large subunit ribosomal protein L25|nr:large subunit ribosomal protein [Chloroflexota bacterium]
MEHDRLEIEAQPRELFGKRARYLRRQGITPANVSGAHIPSKAVQVSNRQIEHILTHVPRSSLLSLVLEGDTVPVLVRDVDRKPTTDELYHVDFLRVSMTERLRVEVPLMLVGEAPAVRTSNATILHQLNSVQVECLPGDLIPSVEVDLGRLESIDDAIYVRDLKLPGNVTVLTDPDELIVKALAPQRIVEGDEEPAAEEAPAAQPTAEAEPATETDGSSDASES